MSQLQLELDKLKIEHFFEVTKTLALKEYTENNNIPSPEFRLNSEDSFRLIKAIRSALDRAEDSISRVINPEPDSTTQNL